MTNICEEHRIRCAIRSNNLKVWVEEQLSRNAGDKHGAASSMFLATFGLDHVYRDHALNMYGSEIDQWAIYRAEDAAHCGGMLMVHICREVIFSAGSEAEHAAHVSAFWSIDFPGSEVGSPRTNEKPSINVVFIAPQPLGHYFSSYVIDSNLTFEWQLNYHFVEFATVEEIGSSEAAISAAVNHVLKFSRTLPSMFFPDEVMSFVTVSNAGLKVIRPTAPADDGGLQGRFR